MFTFLVWTHNTNTKVARPLRVQRHLLPLSCTSCWNLSYNSNCRTLDYYLLTQTLSIYFTQVNDSMTEMTITNCSQSVTFPARFSRKCLANYKRLRVQHVNEITFSKSSFTYKWDETGKSLLEIEVRNASRLTIESRAFNNVPLLHLKVIDVHILDIQDDSFVNSSCQVTRSYRLQASGGKPRQPAEQTALNERMAKLGEF